MGEVYFAHFYKIEGFPLLYDNGRMSRFVVSNQTTISMRQTILLALGNIGISRSICAALLMHPNYKVVHICDNCAEAEEYILNHSPSIVLLDQTLNNNCGVNAMRLRIRKELETIIKYLRCRNLEYFSRIVFIDTS